MLLAAAAREIAHVEDADPSRRAGQSTIRGSRAPFAIGQKAIPSSHPRSAVPSKLWRRRSIDARVGRAHGGFARRQPAHGTRVNGARLHRLLNGTQPASIEPAARAPASQDQSSQAASRFSHCSTSHLPELTTRTVYPKLRDSWGVRAASFDGSSVSSLACLLRYTNAREAQERIVTG